MATALKKEDALRCSRIIYNRYRRL